jgi:DNA-binding LytR/AlgR family response regulator
MVYRFPPPTTPQAGLWLSKAGIHLAAATAFSLAHVAGMVWIRELGYASAGSLYQFAHEGDLVFPFVYEWRKDVLTYASNAVVFWGWGVWQAHRAAQALLAEPTSPSADQRIEIRDGGRVTLIDPAGIGWVEAAGNYVEVHANGDTHLVRGTLAGFEERLVAHGFVRIHRSRLINKARIQAFRPTASGDLEITLDDGRVVGGSRRFRTVLEG